jgi:hypothetical protein
MSIKLKQPVVLMPFLAALDILTPAGDLLTQ